ncbi:tail assembly chaperone [Rhodococcus phage Whack]|uniref:Tail assembly chaperone n=1 Tax=Rhodococcus phage Whack TaxID=2591132 RepID=A0A515MK75_9CAUD|nr:tail assembly chaperone [Rhodococcus phage Whack]QDM57077.1 tail assembly chaperone [Rhodococcus phage Whack]
MSDLDTDRTAINPRSIPMSTYDADRTPDYDDADVVKFGGGESKAPFKFKIGDSPVFFVPEPDSDTVMDIEEARTTRQVLKLFLGEQYEDVADFLGPQHPDNLIDITRAMSRYFGLFDADIAMNRAEKRSRARRGGSRR